MQVSIQNPILPGFNPDPNLLKVGDTYYLAVSSFEWLPGIRIYTSTNLIAWTHLTDVLTEQVQLQGNPLGGSIWAPQLSYHEGLFYCVYTDVKTAQGPFKDCHNYVTVARNVCGPWSAPIYLNSAGFDPSFFHDVDGKTWLLNELWDYRLPTRNKSAGIVMQEYDCFSKKLIGERHFIFAGTDKKKTEAPHLYFHEGYYYLVTAEGGTGSGHTVTICRSKQVTGPYELSPHGAFLTASDKPHSPLQCTGHASFAPGYKDHWVVAYLTTRPVEGAAILGRETAIQEFFWGTDGWPRLVNDFSAPETNPSIHCASPVEQTDYHQVADDFNETTLHPEWNSLRILPHGWVKTGEQGLTMTAGESLSSVFQPHVVAIRQKHHVYEASVWLTFQPTSFNQLAGLTLYLNHQKYLCFFVSEHEEMGKVLRFAKLSEGNFILDERLVPLDKGPVALKVADECGRATFSYRQGQGPWQLYNTEVDTLFLAGGFTGNFIGLFASDLDEQRGTTASFKQFRYRGKTIEKSPKFLGTYDAAAVLQQPSK